MENRNPYDIKWILAIYNLSQIIACFYLIYSVSIAIILYINLIIAIFGLKLNN